MSELSGRVRGVVNTPTPAGASGRWSVRAVNKYVGAGVWPALSLGAFESIATVTVGAGGASSIEFTSIPATYQHLQVRGLIIGSGSGDNLAVRLNSDTGSNYASHQIQGDGSTASALWNASANRMALMGLIGTSSVYPFVTVIDILDYANTSKNTTARAFVGHDANTSNAVFRVGLHSGLWMNTAAVTSVTVTTNSGMTWGEHTTAALYGIKA